MGARMLRKSLAVAVILLFIGVAFAPSINANVSKSSLEPIVDVDTKEEDCGFEEETPLGWNYPFICTILFGVFTIFVTLLIMGASVGEIPFVIDDIGDDLNCYWCDILP